jgi:hypothetical protein
MASLAEDDDSSVAKFVEENDWDSVEQHFQKHPDDAKRIIAGKDGWTYLHWFCSIGSCPVSVLSLIASLHPPAITLRDRRYGDTPLHKVARHSQVTAHRMKALLDVCRVTEDEWQEKLLVRSVFGGTALHAACHHNASLPVIQALVEANPRLTKVTTDEGLHVITTMWHSYMQTIPGYMNVGNILKGKKVDNEHFDRFWKKLEYLAVTHFRQTSSCPSRDRYTESSEAELPYREYVLHGLIQCHVPIGLWEVALKLCPAQSADIQGNTPLHVLLEARPYRLKERESIQAATSVAPESVSVINRHGSTPLLIGIRNRIPWENGLDLVADGPQVLSSVDEETMLLPFQFAAYIGGNVAVETTFRLLLLQPYLINRL